MVMAMIIADTNVVSEIMKEDPQLEVLTWWDNQTSRDLFITTVVEAEIRTGIALLPVQA